MSYTCHSYNYLYHKVLDIFYQSRRIVAGPLYLIYWSVYANFTSGKTSLCLLQIVKGKNSSIDQRKTEFVKKSKVTNGIKSEEVSSYNII